MMAGGWSTDIHGYPFSVDAISNDDFDGVADQTVSVTTTDDDTAGFTIPRPMGHPV